MPWNPLRRDPGRPPRPVPRWAVLGIDYSSYLRAWEADQRRWTEENARIEARRRDRLVEEDIWERKKDSDEMNARAEEWDRIIAARRMQEQRHRQWVENRRRQQAEEQMRRQAEQQQWQQAQNEQQRREAEDRYWRQKGHDDYMRELANDRRSGFDRWGRPWGF